MQAKFATKMDSKRWSQTSSKMVRQVGCVPSLLTPVFSRVSHLIVSKGFSNLGGLYSTMIGKVIPELLNALNAQYNNEVCGQ